MAAELGSQPDLIKPLVLAWIYQLFVFGLIWLFWKIPPFKEVQKISNALEHRKTRFSYYGTFGNSATKTANSSQLCLYWVARLAEHELQSDLDDLGRVFLFLTLTKSSLLLLVMLTHSTAPELVSGILHYPFFETLLLALFFYSSFNFSVELRRNVRRWFHQGAFNI